MTKTIENFLCIIIISAGLLCDTYAYGAENKKPCAPGCFCVYDGKYPGNLDTKNVCGYGVAHRELCEDESISLAFGVGEEGKAYDGVVACGRNNPMQATYYFDEFSELYTGSTGMYGFIGGNLVTMPTLVPELNVWGISGMYQCPSAYPNSASGAKSLLECYKYDKKGNKVYYKKKNSTGNCNATRFKTVIENLQTSLNEAYSAANVLQDALKTKKSNTGMLMKNLQNAIDKANKAEQNLQSVLK